VLVYTVVHKSMSRIKWCLWL